ncbi:MAG: RNA polymerase sigma factor [Myxococcota bacterium]
MEPDDFQLLDAWCGGDRLAGQRLLERHFDTLTRFFQSKCEAEADDLVQRTMLACVAARGTLRRESTFRTWLFTVARNELFQHLRAGRRGGERVDLALSSIEELVTTPTTRLARVAEQRRVHEALRRLPVEQQTLMELHYWEGLEAPELAEVFDLEPGTVRVRLHRAREKLRELLELPAEASEQAVRNAKV